jgi:hypothetical protein
MNMTALLWATGIGTVGQLAMVIAGHSIAFIKDRLFLVLGLAISLIAGAIYAAMTDGGWWDAILGGFVAGGICALIGLVVSFLMRDVPAPVIAFGSLSSAVTGAIGGLVGRLF